MLKKLNRDNKEIILLIILTIFYIVTVRSAIRADRAKNETIKALTAEIETLKADIEELEESFTDYRSGTKEIINSLNNQIKDLSDEIDVQVEQINSDIENVKAQKTEAKKNTESASPKQTKTIYPQNTDGLTSRSGVNYYGDQKETYYNLNMNGVVNNAQANGISGEYWIREDGVKMYGDYVIIAANQDVYSYGSTVETSLGTGIVLDTGGFASENPTQVDIATDW